MAQLIQQIIKQTVKSIANVHGTTTCLRSRLIRPRLAHVRTIKTTARALEAERRYAESHEWVELHDNTGTIGITNYAQEALGDVVYAQLPEVGSIVTKDDEVGALESVKAASEILSPVSGKVVEKNDAVENKPGLVNTSPYKDGWLFKIQLTNLDEYKSLMDEKSYGEYLKNAH